MNDLNILASEEPISKFNGTNFRNAKLNIDGNMVTFRQTWRSKTLLLLFGFGGSLFFIFIALTAIQSTPALSELWGKGLAVYVFLLTVFILILCFLYKVATKTHCFDLIQRHYFCGKRPNGKAIHFNTIKGIQVIKKAIHKGSNKFNSFELNLVTKSGKRIKVIDHSEGDFVKLEAKKIADLLKVELMLINTKA